MSQEIPDIDWYTAISQRKGLPPRCPFASVHRCPRFYESLSLMGEAGVSTKIDPNEDKKLLEKWKHSELWPTLREQATSISGPEENTTSFGNFCPEVSYEIFGLFASTLCKYADEIDKASAYRRLQKESAPADDWEWQV